MSRREQQTPTTASFFDPHVPLLTYGITPPKRRSPQSRHREIAARQTKRIRALPIDALVIYDLQDETARTDTPRPFPFLECIDPADYAFDYLAAVNKPKIVYRGVSRQSTTGLVTWLAGVQQHEHGGAAVLVGAPSHRQSTSLTLGEAYELAGTHVPDLTLGGVLIAERHSQGADEHRRALTKIDRGCSFLISQAVYSVTASKNVLSDLYYTCRDDDRPMPLIMITLSPCGSVKTLEFMHWLGVSVPGWLENELKHSNDILQTSVELALAAFSELHDFARSKGFAIGCNVESVSLRKDEIDASVDMVHCVSEILDRPVAGVAGR